MNGWSFIPEKKSWESIRELQDLETHQKCGKLWDVRIDDEFVCRFFCCWLEKTKTVPEQSESHDTVRREAV